MKRNERKSLNLFLIFGLIFSISACLFLKHNNVKDRTAYAEQNNEVFYNLKSIPEIGKSLLGDSYVVQENITTGPFSTFTHVYFVKEAAPLEATKINLDDANEGNIVAVIEKVEEIKQEELVIQEAKNIVTVYSEGTILAPVDCTCMFGSMFNYATSKATGSDTSLKEIHLDNFDTRNVTDMSAMFLMCTKLSVLTGVENFDTSNVTNMTRLFDRCQILEEVDLSNFKTGKVTNLSTMFQYCMKLKVIDVSKWDTSNVTTIRYMFNQCEVVEVLDVSNWNTSKIVDMTYVFNRCYKLKELDVTKWDTSSATTMDRMFQLCQSLKTLDLSNFDTSNVTTMNAMFQYDGELEYINLDNFNTSNVTDFQWMFGRCTHLKELDLSSFDTSKVKDMVYMFGDCPDLKTLNISSFTTNSLTSYQPMFRNNYALNDIYMNLDFKIHTNAGPAIFNLWSNPEGTTIAPENTILAHLYESEVGVYELTKLDTFLTNAPKITVGTTKRLITLTKLEEAPTVASIPYTGSEFYYDSNGRYFITGLSSDIGLDMATIYWCDSTGTIQKLNGSVETEKQVLNIFFGTQTYLYDGAIHTPNITCNKATGDEVNLVTEIRDGDNNLVTEPKDIGEYTVKVTGITGEDSTKYVLPETVTSTFEIVPYPIKPVVLVLDFGSLELNYNNGSNVPTISLNKYFKDEIELVTEVYNSKGELVTEAKDIGTYTIKVVGIEGKDASKYVLPEEGLSKSFDVITNVITPYELTLGLDQNEFGYDNLAHIPNVVFNKDSKDEIELVTEIRNSDNNLVTEPKDIGTYTVKVTSISGKDAAKYALPDVSSLTFKIVTNTSTLYELTLEFGDLEFDFDNNVHTPTVLFDKADGDNVQLNIKYYNSKNYEVSEPKEVGTYTIKVVSLKGADATKYKLPSDCSRTFKIVTNVTTPYELTLESEELSFAHDKESHIPSIITNKTAYDDINLVYEITDENGNLVSNPTKVGKYTLKVISISGEDAAKYVLPENTTFTFEITSNGASKTALIAVGSTAGGGGLIYLGVFLLENKKRWKHLRNK